MPCLRHMYTPSATPRPSHGPRLRTKYASSPPCPASLRTTLRAPSLVTFLGWGTMAAPQCASTGTCAGASSGLKHCAFRGRSSCVVGPHLPPQSLLPNHRRHGKYHTSPLSSHVTRTSSRYQPAPVSLIWGARRTRTDFRPPSRRSDAAPPGATSRNLSLVPGRRPSARGCSGHSAPLPTSWMFTGEFVPAPRREPVTTSTL
mmetsp:Transcript_10968/g.38053  ORF Transcript_10968/g.38053 Transcript_10968/m.38053 type:complete len:202 (-) Transcript_10968:226-831(-)